MRLLLILGCALLPLLASAQTDTARAAPAIPDVQYPRELTSPQGRIVTHAPQIKSWTGYEMINGVSAVEVSLAAMGTPAFGSIYYTAKTVTDLDRHVVTFYDIKLDKISFPQASGEQADALTEFVRATLGRGQLALPLEVVLQYLDDDIIPRGRAGEFSMAPPVMFYSDTDSRLLSFDGEPMLQPIQKTDLQFAVNTNWDLFYIESEATWYLLDDKRWLSLSGKKIKSESSKWQPVATLPPVFKQLPDVVGWETVKKAIPAIPSADPVPVIFVSEQPAELILTTGEPELAALGTSGISYVSNTESDLFLYGRTYYFLVSGRWFASRNLDGKWEPVDVLPEKFGEIPADSPKGYVLVAVPGTDEAKMALLEAVIPRKAEVSRDYEPPITVAYTEGKPQFERIEPTDVYRAVNTSRVVLSAEDMYYLCYNAAWFVSADPVGPWKVAEKVPQVIYSIPASSAAYNCTHVYVYDSNSDYVTTGYNSGYFNVYTSYTVMYGTGYYYYPYYYYPYYYGYRPSYGSAAWYNPNTGNYGGRQTVYGPYGGASRTAVYNPETGAYARGRAVWDSDSIARQGVAYNPSTGNGVATNRYRSDDSAWGQSIVKRDDNWVATQTERQGNTATTDFRTSGGTSGTLNREVNDGTMTGSGEISRNGNTIDTRMARNENGVARGFTDQDGNRGGYVKNSDGDLYAGKDGNVYKREDGEWSKHGDGGWEPVDPGQREPRGNGDGNGYREMGSGNQGDRDFDTGPMRDDMGRNPDRDYQRQPDRANNADSLNQLNRDRSARQQGFDRHNSRPSRGSMQRGGGMRRGGGGGLRRR